MFEFANEKVWNGIQFTPEFLAEVKDDLERLDEEWTPGYGRPYFREPKFYESPKVKEVDLPEARVNVPRPQFRKFNRFYTNDEILSIWAKPLEGYEVTEEERAMLHKNPLSANALNVLSEESPCRCHILNMFLDRCQNPDLGRDPKTMLQHTACNYHWFRFMKCVSKHWRWYEARRDALRAAMKDEHRELLEPAKVTADYNVNPYEAYPEYANAKDD